MGEIIKDEQTFINITHLNNYQVLEKIKKEIENLEKQKVNFIKKNEEVKILIDNFKKSIDYWVDQNQKLETKICYYQKQINKLEKQKINKIKNFFINLFSFKKINKNKKINNLIEIEEINCEILKQTKLNNEKKINNLNLNYIGKKDEYANLITNINETLEQENKLLIKLMNYEKNQQQKITVAEVNEQKVENNEAKVRLTEKICVLAKQLSTSSSDEGFNSESTSASSLQSNFTVPFKIKRKLQISKPVSFKKSDKPWEQTLRQYDYPTNNYKQKSKITKPKMIKL